MYPFDFAPKGCEHRAVINVTEELVTAWEVGSFHVKWTAGIGSMQELGEKFSINNDPILHFDFFCAYQAGTLHFEKRERLIGSEKVKM